MNKAEAALVAAGFGAERWEEVTAEFEGRGGGGRRSEVEGTKYSLFRAPGLCRFCAISSDRQLLLVAKAVPKIARLTVVACGVAEQLPCNSPLQRLVRVGAAHTALECFAEENKRFVWE